MNQVVAIFAATEGYFDGVETEKVRRVEASLLQHLESQHRELLEKLAQENTLEGQDREALAQAVGGLCGHHPGAGLDHGQH